MRGDSSIGSILLSTFETRLKEERLKKFKGMIKFVQKKEKHQNEDCVFNIKFHDTIPKN